MIDDMPQEGSSDNTENQNDLKEIEREKGTSSSKIHESISPHVPNTVVESDYGKYPSLSETRSDEFRKCKAVRPSFARTAADKCAEVGAKMSGRSLSSQRKVIVRPRNSENPTQATDGDEEILVEEAVCKFCFAKLYNDDLTLKTRCGCGSVLIHEKCIANWCRVIYDSNDNCEMCKKEVQKVPIILITDLIPVKSKGSKWSWSSWLKR